jgi:FMN phosphatase YigB (HAD superfamily)
MVFDKLSSYRGNYSTYQDGVFFVNGTGVSKGEAFLSFLEKIDFYPDKIVFVDDREENLKSLEAAIQKLGKSIEYHGLHYVGAQYYPSKIISEEEFESRWQQLAAQAKEME